MTILLIEDNHLQRLAMARILGKAGHNVMLAEDGGAGLRMAREHLPDVIILDMMLPVLVGTCVLEALKSDQRMAQIPVIISTGLSQRNEAKLRGAGAAGFYEKSGLDLENGLVELLRVIAQVVSETGIHGTQPA
jgi:two-component system cell cycle response regulator DivK